jgi:hypothetical protein
MVRSVLKTTRLDVSPQVRHTATPCCLLCPAFWVLTPTHMPTQTAFTLLFDDAGSFFTALHGEVTQDPGCTISSWTSGADGHTVLRRVRFTKQLDVPPVVARLLGNVSSLLVDDTQVLHHPRDATACGQDAPVGVVADLPAVVSLPLVVQALPGLDKLTTRVTTWFTALPGDAAGCGITTLAVVDASRVFGLQRVLETQMLSEATASVTAWHDFAAQYVARPHSAAAPCMGLTLYRDRLAAAVGDDAFFDAPSVFTSALHSRPVTPDAAAPDTAALADAAGDWLSGALLRGMVELQSTLVAHRACLVALEARCDAIGGDVACLVAAHRAAAARARVVRYAGVCGVAALGTWAIYARYSRRHGGSA